MIRHAFLLLASLLLCACHRPAETMDSRPPQSVVRALQRGINIAVWSADRNMDPIHAAQVHPDNADLELIQSLGLRHVRIAFDPAWLTDERLRLRDDRLREMRGDLQRMVDHGLFVVLAMQPSSEFKKRLGSEPKLVARVAELWRKLAGQLAGFSPEQIAYELLNEPELEDATKVRNIMETLATAVRQSGSRHTLVVAGPRYADYDDLIKLTPLTDGNVIYSFHFYEPKNFTHQGVPYGWPIWGLLHDLPYPSTPEDVAPALDFMPLEAAQHARWYGEQRWNRGKLAALLAQVSQWAKQNHVVVWCSEFGVYRYTVKPEDRKAWLGDVRGLLEASGMGWALWDYSGYFGIVSGPQGHRVLDREIAKTLGLDVDGDAPGSGSDTTDTASPPAAPAAVPDTAAPPANAPDAARK